MTVEKASKIIKRIYIGTEQVWKPYGKRYFCAIINGRPAIFTEKEIKNVMGDKNNVSII